MPRCKIRRWRWRSAWPRCRCVHWPRRGARSTSRSCSTTRVRCRSRRACRTRWARRPTFAKAWRHSWKSAPPSSAIADLEAGRRFAMQRRTVVKAISGVALLAGSGVRGQALPNKPIRYIVPVAAGGGSDMVGRTVTERWGKHLGQSFVVDNQGGGGGVIACQLAARAPADGYTLLQGYVATHGTSPATRKVPYDPIRDFTPIGMIGA